VFHTGTSFGCPNQSLFRLGGDDSRSRAKFSQPTNCTGFLVRRGAAAQRDDLGALRRGERANSLFLSRLSRGRVRRSGRGAIHYVTRVTSRTQSGRIFSQRQQMLWFRDASSDLMLRGGVSRLSQIQRVPDASGDPTADDCAKLCFVSAAEFNCRPTSSFSGSSASACLYFVIAPS